MTSLTDDYEDVGTTSSIITNSVWVSVPPQLCLLWKMGSELKTEPRKPLQEVQISWRPRIDDSRFR